MENNDNKREEVEEEEEVKAEADEGIQLEPGCGFILCTGGAKGIDQLAEELALQYGVKVEVLIPPGHPRKRTVTPLHPRVLTLANSHLEAAADKLKKSLPTQNYVLHLLQRNFEIVRRADTVYAFGTLEDDCQRVRGGTGWAVQMALDLGKKVYVCDAESEIWFHSVYGHKLVGDRLDTGAIFVHIADRDRPLLHQNSAIVGTRLLNNYLEGELRKLFARSPPPQHGKKGDEARSFPRRDSNLHPCDARTYALYQERTALLRRGYRTETVPFSD